MRTDFCDYRCIRDYREISGSDSTGAGGTEKVEGKRREEEASPRGLRTVDPATGIGTTELSASNSAS